MCNNYTTLYIFIYVFFILTLHYCLVRFTLSLCCLYTCCPLCSDNKRILILKYVEFALKYLRVDLSSYIPPLSGTRVCWSLTIFYGGNPLLQSVPELSFLHERLQSREGTHLEFSWHNEFGSIDSYEHINPAEDEDGQDDGKVTDEFPHLGESQHKHFTVTRCSNIWTLNSSLWRVTCWIK